MVVDYNALTENVKCLKKLIGHISAKKEINYKAVLGTIPQVKEYIEDVDELSYYQKRKLFLNILNIIITSEIADMQKRCEGDMALHRMLTDFERGITNFCTKNKNFHTRFYEIDISEFKRAQSQWSELLLRDLENLEHYINGD